MFLVRRDSLIRLWVQPEARAKEQTIRAA